MLFFFSFFSWGVSSFQEVGGSREGGHLALVGRCCCALHLMWCNLSFLFLLHAFQTSVHWMLRNILQVVIFFWGGVSSYQGGSGYEAGAGGGLFFSSSSVVVQSVRDNGWHGASALITSLRCHPVQSPVSGEPDLRSSLPPPSPARCDPPPPSPFVLAAPLP